MFSILSRRCPLLATSLSVLFCLLSMLISNSRFDLVWFRLFCDHGWIRSGSVNVRKKTTKTSENRCALKRKRDVTRKCMLPEKVCYEKVCYPKRYVTRKCTLPEKVCCPRNAPCSWCQFRCFLVQNSSAAFSSPCLRTSSRWPSTTAPPFSSGSSRPACGARLAGPRLVSYWGGGIIWPILLIILVSKRIVISIEHIDDVFYPSRA